jgi:hypothetical protein
MKAGIITMHKVPNYGSHLQAYALQETVKEFGYEAELIDYKYPNEYHIARDKELAKKEITLTRFIKSILKCPITIFNKIILIRQRKLFKDFENKFYNLSSAYNSQEDIKKASPAYDIYITGGDQVWNPRFACGDDVYMCNFGDFNKSRIAFGASVAATNIPESMKEIYKENLRKYKAVGIRDSSSKEPLEKITEKEINIVYDPVFLRNSSQWNELSKLSKLKLPKEYILVYILTYSFEPYPQIIDVIRDVKNTLGLPVVFVNTSLRHYLQVKPDKNIFTASVSDFLKLFANASYVLTTSFHGTAFSIIFQRQFLSIINDSKKDSRISDLQRTVRLNNYCTLNEYNNRLLKKQIDYNVVSGNVEQMIKKSRDFLKNAVGTN